MCFLSFYNYKSCQLRQVNVVNAGHISQVQIMLEFQMASYYECVMPFSVGQLFDAHGFDIMCVSIFPESKVLGNIAIL